MKTPFLILAIFCTLFSMPCAVQAIPGIDEQKLWANDVEEDWAPGLKQCMQDFDDYMAGKRKNAISPEDCYEKAQVFWQKRYEKASRNADRLCTRICTGGNTLNEDFDDCLALRKRLKQASESSMALFEEYAAKIWGVHEPSGASRYEFQQKVKMLGLRSMTLMYEAILAHRNAYVDDNALDVGTREYMEEIKDEEYNNAQKRRQEMENSFK